MALDTSTRMNVRLRMNLALGYADIAALTKELITKVEAGVAADASKAFQTLYRKAGAMEAATVAANKKNSSVCSGVLRDAVASFRTQLDVIAGATRETQEIVVGDSTLKDEQRRKLLVDTLGDIAAVLEEAVVADVKQTQKYAPSLLEKA